MKFYTLWIAFFLSIILLPSILFAQNLDDIQFLELENLSVFEVELLQSKGKINSAQSRDDDDLLIGTKKDDWDNGSWINDDSIEYYYNANNLLIEGVHKSFGNNNILSNNFRFLYEYDANGNRTLRLKQDWNGINWIDDYKDNYQYDANNNQILFLNQDWENNNWVTDYQFIYEYDANNNQTLRLNQDWENNSWVTDYQQVSQYDANNNLIFRKQQNWNNNSWEDSSQTTYEYNANGYQIGAIGEDWTGNEWINDFKYISEYDANNNRTLSSWESWENNNWENNFQFVSEFDMDNNLTLNLYQNGEGNTWENQSQSTYEYDQDNNRVFRLAQSWDNNSWENSARWYYYYQIITSNNELANLDHPISISPNPNNGNFELNLGENELLNGQVHIYNAIGKRIYSEHQSSGNNISTSIDLRSLPKGIYFLQVLDGNKQSSETIKLIKGL